MRARSWLLLAVAAALPAQHAEVEALCAPLVKDHPGVALVVGIVTAQGRHVHAFGGPEVSGATIFEIGSITKVFTGTLLALLVREQKVKLEDPVQELLPAGTVVPARGERRITLLDLATHTSALPRLPGNMRPKDQANPYADYSVAQLHAFLAEHELRRDIGERYEYSNLGVGLLGHALALRDGRTWEAAVVARICEPLRLADTSIQLDDSRRARLAPGHDGAGKPAKNWDLPTLAGAGALRASADDMLRFAAANLGLAEPPAELLAAMRDAQAVHWKGQQQLGLCWHHGQVPEVGAVLWHNGGTGGYRSFLALCPERRVAVVALIAMSRSVDDLGRGLLRLAAKR